jgi:hypothetical protein
MLSSWIPGPIPLEPSLGQVYIDVRTDWKALATNNGMLSDTITTAYLNVLVKSHHHMGVRRSSASFLPIIYHAHQQYGPQGGFHSAVDTMKDMKTGCHIINWETDPIIFLQIFQGNTTGGSWSLAIVDRTSICKQGTVVLFDSMPARFPDTLNHLKEWLGESPLTTEGCNWITADIPIQAINSNDCGVWMCCMASLYIQHLFNKDRLPISGNIQEQRISCVSVVTAKDVSEIGRHGRNHMIDTIKTGNCDLNHTVFHCLHITN